MIDGDVTKATGMINYVWNIAKTGSVFGRKRFEARGG